MYALKPGALTVGTLALYGLIDLGAEDLPDFGLD
jgi:hypothetical protein